MFVPIWKSVKSKKKKKNRFKKNIHPEKKFVQKTKKIAQKKYFCQKNGVFYQKTRKNDPIWD